MTVNGISPLAAPTSRLPRGLSKILGREIGRSNAFMVSDIEIGRFAGAIETAGSSTSLGTMTQSLRSEDPSGAS